MYFVRYYFHLSESCAPKEALIKPALEEDFGDGDVTSDYFVPEGLQARALMRPRSQGVLSGVKVAEAVFRAVAPTLRVEVYLQVMRRIIPLPGGKYREAT